MTLTLIRFNTEYAPKYRGLVNQSHRRLSIVIAVKNISYPRAIYCLWIWCYSRFIQITSGSQLLWFEWSKKNIRNLKICLLRSKYNGLNQFEGKKINNLNYHFNEFISNFKPIHIKFAPFECSSKEADSVKRLFYACKTIFSSDANFRANVNVNIQKACCSIKFVDSRILLVQK